MTTTKAVARKAPAAVVKPPYEPTPYEIALGDYLALLHTEPPTVTDMQLHHYKVIGDALGPLTAADIDAARQVIVQQKGNGSIAAAWLSPLLEAYFAGRAAT